MGNRDIIWITIDSLRADFTSVIDHGTASTPCLAELATKGIAFQDCYSHDIWTRSSTASILTGHPPSAHQTWSNDATIPESITSLPEAFRAAGYLTVGISDNGQLSSATGLDRGFESFHSLKRSTLLEEAGLRGLAKWVFHARQHAGGYSLNPHRHTTGYLVYDLAKRHMKTTASDKPMFMYIHFNDSHHSYIPPAVWLERYGQDLQHSIDEAVRLARDMSLHLHEYIALDDPFSDNEWATLRTLYTACIEYVDHLVGELVTAARQHREDPIIVVTADHGEFLGEGGLLAHMLRTTAPVSHVPLVITGLEDLAYTGFVQHADMMNILVKEMDVDHPVPAGQDIRTTPREFAITQRGGIRAREKLDRITDHNPTYPVTDFHQEDMTTLRTDEFVYRHSADRCELADRNAERSDISHEHPEITDQLHEKTESWLETVGQPVGTPGEATFDEATENHLRELGYLQ